MKNRIILFVLFVGIILVAGCTKNVYYTPPPPQQNNYQVQETQNLPTDEQSIEKRNEQLFYQWANMYQWGDPDDLPQILEQINTWNFEVIKIFKGSLILHENSYGYVWVPGWDKQRWLNSNYDYSRNAEILRQKYNGGITTVFSYKEEAVVFQNLNDLENFLTEFWSVQT